MLHRAAGPLRCTAALVAALALGAKAAPAQAASDPMLDDQWALTDRATGAPTAWTQTHGTGVLVAILDSGIQLDHPDLAGSLWRNPDEVPGNGVDDDRNGYVDDVHGANVNGLDGAVDDDNGHGTHVAGILAAQAGNGTGGAGIAPGARIMSVKVLDADRAGDSSELATGIRYAIDEGARILNVSINGDGTSADLDAALRYAGERGATIVASAGNDGRDLDLTPSYPASSREPAVLTVTATQPTGSLLSIANHGLRSVELAAPGGRILSTASGSRYELREGTSMAAPFVAGTLALLSAARRDLDQPAPRAAVVRSATPQAALSGALGSGALNAAAALRSVLPGDMWRAAPASSTAAVIRLEVSAKSRIRAGRSATVRWRASATERQRVVRWRVLLDGKRVKTLSSAKSLLRKRISRSGTHRWKVVGVDAAGERVVVAARTFKVLPRR